MPESQILTPPAEGNLVVHAECKKNVKYASFSLEAAVPNQRSTHVTGAKYTLTGGVSLLN